MRFLMTENKIKFYLNDKQVEADKDETIWQVANRLGTEIPHLCYSNKPGYRSDGNCRACMVEIEGERVLAASCIRKPINEMKVKTSSEKAKKSRDLVFELLLSDQPKKNVAHIGSSNKSFSYCLVIPNSLHNRFANPKITKALPSGPVKSISIGPFFSTFFLIISLNYYSTNIRILF